MGIWKKWLWVFRTAEWVGSLGTQLWEARSTPKRIWEAIGARRFWLGAIVTGLAEVVGMVLDAPPWVHVAILLGLILSILGIIDVISHRRLRDQSTAAEPLPLPPVIPEPRVVTKVDPGKSQASQGKGHPLIVQVFVTIENGLDVDVRLSKLELDIEWKDELLACRFAHFQRRFHNGMDPNIATHRIEQYDEISVPPRQFIDGWVCFKHDIIRIEDFKRFVFTAQAIGEPEQAYSLEPYDWAEATNYKSSLVLKEDL